MEIENQRERGMTDIPAEVMALTTILNRLNGRTLADIAGLRSSDTAKVLALASSALERLRRYAQYEEEIEALVKKGGPAR